MYNILVDIVERDEVQVLKSMVETLQKQNKIVIRNQVALDDKFSDMCIDISEALNTISNAMQSLSGNEPKKEEEEEIKEEEVSNIYS